MKTIICSDLHLTASFDAPKFAFLSTLFSQADKIIMNGDFWDGYETSFEHFVRSPWKNLFPLMQEKTIYLYGNHDTEHWTSDPSVFSREQRHSYVHNAGKTVLYVEHGHKLSPSFDISYPKMAYILSTFLSSRRFQFGRKLHGWENMQMKKYATTHMQENEILVCGHSHIAEYNLRCHYINTGVIDFGVASYLCIENSKLSLMMQTYG